MILDGWGIGDHAKDDVIFNTPTPYWDYLLATYPNSQLQASGENVGLPDGQMGNSDHSSEGFLDRHSRLMSFCSLPYLQAVYVYPRRVFLQVSTILKSIPL